MSRVRQREIKCHEEREGRHRHLVFYCSSRTCLFADFVFTSSVWVRPLFGAHPRMKAVIFCRLHIILTCGQRSSFHRCVCCPTNPFPVFDHTFPLTFFFFPVWVSSCQLEPASDFSWHIYIFYLDACCYDDLDFGNLPFSFLFVSPFSSCLHVSLLASFIFLIYVPLPSTVPWSTSNSLGNNSQSTRAPSYITHRVVNQ